MLNGVLDFAIGGFYGGGIGNLLSYWEQAGFFTYVLPFLLIFAVVFGISTKTKIFGEQNKGLIAIISIVVGLLALQFDFVPLFFAEIFPRLGIGLSVILALLILIGLFLPADPNNKYANWMMLIVGVIVFLFVLAKSFGTFYWWNSIYSWYRISPEIITIVVVLAVLGIVIGSVKPNKPITIPGYPMPVYRSP